MDKVYTSKVQLDPSKVQIRGETIIGLATTWRTVWVLASAFVYL